MWFQTAFDLVSISPKDKWREGYHQEIRHSGWYQYKFSQYLETWVYPWMDTCCNKCSENSGWYQYKFGQFPETWAYPRVDACCIKCSENFCKLKSIIVVFDLTHHYVGQMISQKWVARNNYVICKQNINIFRSYSITNYLQVYTFIKIIILLTF